MAATHPRLLFPVTIGVGAAERKIEFDEGGGDISATISASELDVFVRGSVPNASDICNLIAAAMTLAGANTYGVTVDTDGNVTIARTAGANNFSLHWNTDASSTFYGRILGFDVSADDGPGTTFTSDYQHRYGWYPEKFLIDGYRFFSTAVVGGARSLGGQQYVQQWKTDIRGVLRIDFVPVVKLRYFRVSGTRLLAAAGEDNEAFSSSSDDSALVGLGMDAASFTFPSNHPVGFYEWARTGGRFEIHPDVDSQDQFITAVIDADEIERWGGDLTEAAELIQERGEKYRVEVPWRPYVT